MFKVREDGAGMTTIRLKKEIENAIKCIDEGVDSTKKRKHFCIKYCC
jgi:hypothetical protein